jgi:RNA polymerase sigma factor (sigma-70 family)
MYPFFTAARSNRNPDPELLATDPHWPCARTAANLAACMAIIRRWTAPSHWSVADWHDEMWQVARRSAWLAEHDLSRAMLIDFDKFIMRRVIGSAFSQYRSELNRARRFVPHPPSDFEAEDGASPIPIPVEDRDPAREIVRDALAAVPEDQRKLLELLFNYGLGETQAGDILGLSQQEVSRRKKAALLCLRTELESSLTLHE